MRLHRDFPFPAPQEAGSINAVSFPNHWLTHVVLQVKNVPGAWDNTRYELQALDWLATSPLHRIDSSLPADWMSVLRLRGVCHYGIPPMTSSTITPSMPVIRPALSTARYGNDEKETSAVGYFMPGHPHSGTLIVKGVISLLDNNAQAFTPERVLFYSAVAVLANLLLIGRAKYHQIRFRVGRRTRRPGLTAQQVARSLPVAQHHQLRLSTARCARVGHCADEHIQRVTVKHG